MIVIKYGGNALPNVDSNDPVLEAIADAFLDGEQIVLVHGGGPQIDKALEEKIWLVKKLLVIVLQIHRFLR